MIGLKQKTRPDPAPESAWDKARERHAEIQGRLAALETKRAGLVMALSLARNPRDNARVAEHHRAAAAPHLQLAEDHPDRLLKQIRDVDDELEAVEPTVRASAEEFEVAKRREIRRRAVALQPQHRAAVQKIADALDALEAGIAAEQTVRAKIGLGTSANLPDCSSDFVGLEIDGWRRRVGRLGLGIID